jgi:hypothetical protein
MPISRQQLVNELLPALDKLFGDSYAQLNHTEYHIKRKYGKCTIYRWDFVDGKRTSTTLAKHIDLELAEGMMKLLKEPNEHPND